MAVVELLSFEVLVMEVQPRSFCHGHEVMGEERRERDMALWTFLWREAIPHGLTVFQSLDPNLRPISEGLKKWQESEQRRATAAGFASMDEYHRHQESQDPDMCRIGYELYKECISKGYSSHCDGYRKNCPQFK
ncbi:hypothetical protein CMV_012928 [Castanea mollissima]|uniref:Uncharacterized protein n=1 Tax=Castanea mollissima TaxID=60419 RepID=A0A8J4REP2_9ROSI|nr:hypothetical protein CMV_012928 [Castanea mollissima]